MNLYEKIKVRLAGLLAMIALCFALSAPSSAAILNTASVTYKDAANNSLNATSNIVSITTPPVITSALTATGDANLAFSYQITASNLPTSFSALPLPAGLSVNAAGLISGTPTTPGTTNVTIGATNSAGTGSATLAITVRGAAVITLNKTASVANAKPGDTITFTITYQNTGTGSASTVNITDVIPAGSTLVAGSMGTGTLTGSTITWTIGTVAAGGTGSVSFKVTAN